MKQELSFEQWFNEVKSKVALGGIQVEIDEDLAFMAYEMEEKTVEEAVAEIIESEKR